MWPLPLVLLVLVGVVVVMTRTAGFRIEPYSGAIPDLAVPTGYHITYKVEPQGSTEEVFVRRPFEGVDEHLTHGERTIVIALRLGEQVIRSHDAAASLVYTAFAPVRRDIRLDAVVRDAVRAHRLAMIGRARVLDTPCFVFRSQGSLNAGPLQPIGRRSYVDSCIDRRGLLLYERTTSAGKVSTEKTATHVAVGRSAASADYDMKGDAAPANRGGGGMHALAIDSRPSSGPFWDIAHAPKGFRHTGRYAVVPSQPQAFANDAPIGTRGLPGSLVASIDDVYTSGPDAFVIEQGSTVNDAKFSPPPGGVSVDLGPVLGNGQLLLSASASEVVAEPRDATRFVRVVGTLPPAELLRIARGLTLQPPGEMRRAP